MIVIAAGRVRTTEAPLSFLCGLPVAHRRWTVGLRVMLAGGALVMAVGQLTLALAHDVPVALVARVLIGAGDAPVFVGATRLVAEWFPPRNVPVMVQVTGLIGQSGALASAIPVAWLLHTHGWSTTFEVPRSPLVDSRWHLTVPFSHSLRPAAPPCPP